MYEKDVPDFAPEDCEECGLEAGQFDDEDFWDGHYHCPGCGAIAS